MFWVNLKIAAAWCRQHWRWLVLSIAFVVVYVFGRKGSKSIKLQAELARKQYLREKQAIQRSHDIEIKKREEAEERYSDAVDIIEKRHEESKQDLTRAKKEEIKKMVRKAKEDPGEVDRILEEQLGIKKK